MLGTAELPITIIAWGVICIFIFGVIKGFLEVFFAAKDEVQKEQQLKQEKNRVSNFYKRVLGDFDGR